MGSRDCIVLEPLEGQHRYDLYERAIEACATLTGRHDLLRSKTSNTAAGWEWRRRDGRPRYTTRTCDRYVPALSRTGQIFAQNQLPLLERIRACEATR